MRRELIKPATEQMISYTTSDLENMSRRDFVYAIEPLLNQISSRSFPSRNGPLPLIGLWMKTYTREEIYSVILSVFLRNQKIDCVAAYMRKALMGNRNKKEVHANTRK